MAIEGLKILALIPARGGSKGVPGKNIRPLAGKPLIAYAIEAAMASVYIDRTVLSSDDEAIMAVAREWGCDVPFKRPAELATDASPSIDPVLHALDQLPGFDILVLLQSTSPLRTAQDIDACIEQLIRAKAPACVAVTPVSEPPAWMFSIDSDSRLKPYSPSSVPAPTRRQDTSALYIPNGAVYVAETTFLRQRRSFFSPDTAGWVMPAERSIDIDSLEDFRYTEFLLSARI